MGLFGLSIADKIRLIVEAVDRAIYQDLDNETRRMLDLTRRYNYKLNILNRAILERILHDDNLYRTIIQNKDIAEFLRDIMKNDRIIPLL